jgi:hypothetical protein
VSWRPTRTAAASSVPPKAQPGGRVAFQGAQEEFGGLFQGQRQAAQLADQHCGRAGVGIAGAGHQEPRCLVGGEDRHVQGLADGPGRVLAGDHDPARPTAGTAGPTPQTGQPRDQLHRRAAENVRPLAFGEFGTGLDLLAAGDS